MVNESMYDNYHSFMVVPQCVHRLGQLDAKFMSALDLINAYCQLASHESSQHYVAFTIPERDKFVLTVTPGPHGAQNLPLHLYPPDAVHFLWIQQQCDFCDLQTMLNIHKSDYCQCNTCCLTLIIVPLRVNVNIEATYFPAKFKTYCLVLDMFMDT